MKIYVKSANSDILGTKESSEQLNETLWMLSTYLTKHQDKTTLVADCIPNITKSRRTGSYVIRFERISAYGDHYTQVESAKVAKQAVLDYLKSIGLYEYVSATYPYKDGGRGELWFSVSVYFDKTVINEVE